MRLELHDSALGPEPSEDAAAVGTARQRSGLGGGLRKALGSLSSATMKVGCERGRALLLLRCAGRLRRFSACRLSFSCGQSKDVSSGFAT